MKTLKVMAKVQGSDGKVTEQTVSISDIGRRLVRVGFREFYVDTLGTASAIALDFGQGVIWTNVQDVLASVSK